MGDRIEALSHCSPLFQTTQARVKLTINSFGTDNVCFRSQVAIWFLFTLAVAWKDIPTCHPFQRCSHLPKE